MLNIRWWRTWDQSALCSVVLAVLSKVVAVPSLVVLAGRLACYTEAIGYVWPADAHFHRVIDERRQLSVEFLLVLPCPGNPL